jgi:hypothetical protein
VYEVFGFANALRTAATTAKEAPPTEQLAEEILIYECILGYGD